MIKIGSKIRTFGSLLRKSKAWYSSILDNQTNLTVRGKANQSNALITVSASETNILKRTPVSLCLVVDVSGSMSNSVPIKTKQGGNYEDFGFSRLDLVKHALSTIQASLGAEDELSIVNFSDEILEVLPLTKMNEVGKLRMELALSDMKAEGSTNLWGGLKKGLDLMSGIQNQKNTSILLLTDGEPNIIPPRGHLPSLKRYKQTMGRLPATINTFGFGYSLDSQLLWELSKESLGNYCFIPDGSFVGTVFINALSNLMSVSACDVKLTLKDIKASEIPNSSYLTIESSNNSSTVHLSNINFSQSRNVVLAGYQLNGAKFLDGILEYKCPFTGRTIHKDVRIDFEASDAAPSEVEVQRIRMAAAELVLNLKGMSSDIKRCFNAIEDFVSSVEAKPEKNDPLIKDLLLDLKDQVSVAFSKQEYYKKWGQHYLPSLAMAHINEICNNFKDAGVQHYGGKTFNDIRDELDEVFTKIPPPKPSLSGGISLNFTNMAIFHNSSAPCFHGDSSVLLKNGLKKLVKDIKKGDVLSGINGESSTVLAVVKTKINDRKCKLVELDGGLKITPWHPIFYQGEYVFPAQIKTPVLQACDFVYNFVLESGHSIEINGIRTVTLGHGLKGRNVEHQYFGSDKVINDLRGMKGWSEGLVQLEDGCCLRDSETGTIWKMIQKGLWTDLRSSPVFH